MLERPTMETERIGENPERKTNLAIPAAIVIAGALIAGALYVANRGPEAPAPAATGSEAAKIRPVDSSDHILGNPAAPVVIVEYSDLECPFCKTFHATMHRIIDFYGKDGSVAWVYRHFPLPQLHSKAIRESEASECAAELGGNDAFWKYVDRIFAVTPSNDGLDLALLPEIAADVGLDRAAFERCLTSGKYRAKIEASYDEAIAIGARGTPHSVIIANGEYIPIEGAQPFGALQAVIDAALKERARPGVGEAPVIRP